MTPARCPVALSPLPYPQRPSSTPAPFTAVRPGSRGEVAHNGTKWRTLEAPSLAPTRKPVRSASRCPEPFRSILPLAAVIVSTNTALGRPPGSDSDGSINRNRMDSVDLEPLARVRQGQSGVRVLLHVPSSGTGATLRRSCGPSPRRSTRPCGGETAPRPPRARSCSPARGRTGFTRPPTRGGTTRGAS